MERRDIDMDKHEQNKDKNMYRTCGLLMKNDNDGKTLGLQWRWSLGRAPKMYNESEVMEIQYTCEKISKKCKGLKRRKTKYT